MNKRATGFLKASCSNKVHWPSRKAAKQYMKRKSRTGAPYKCRFCKGYHISSVIDMQSKRAIRAIRNEVGEEM